jgi:hypothetical protein
MPTPHPLAQTTNAPPVSPIGLRISRVHWWTQTSSSRVLAAPGPQNIKMGTLCWKWLDNNRKEHAFLIPKSFHVPGSMCDCSAPTLKPDPEGQDPFARHRLQNSAAQSSCSLLKLAEDQANSSSRIEQCGHVSDCPWTCKICCILRQSGCQLATHKTVT